MPDLELLDEDKSCRLSKRVHETGINVCLVSLWFTSLVVSIIRNFGDLDIVVVFKIVVGYTDVSIFHNSDNHLESSGVLHMLAKPVGMEVRIMREERFEGIR